ncbi:phosphoribosyl-AMP cyclohydrolase [Companilactobacillus ginsenosidimutans]|uniref:Phosphoribosyl-AMP cyclohydrolase n=1 Tax=Companilactobacillus ginsenosidimutans TaxID=1007676 RepID=A0A0H4QNW3_9LACO|nr:phosphoribosyl-AMP cyclohydrolase [Companilactobacillus ginsenosidimutans]AKP68483.1 phosphoribosyl-AMP cyclohydrolase [Companilactobacillus ginsenosidimutans]
MEPDFSKGLLTTVIQDAASKDILMVAWMNQESYQKTLDSGQTWFWSRSRKELWHKGETSGNFQDVVSMTLDCDEDTLLITVNPHGPACHTGHRSCFFQPVEVETNKE